MSQYITRNTLLLWGIFIIALLLRIVKLGSLPYDFHEDEVLSGFIGHFIIQNGKDIYGNSWPPFYFNKFGDYFIILPIYLSGISTFIFGVNEFATRFPSAFFGGLAIFPVYLLANYTFKNKTVGLIAAFFCAIAPWQIVFARSTNEGIIGGPIFLFGIISIILFVRKHNLWFLLLSVILFLITYDIYHPFRFYTPFVYMPLLFLPKLRQSKKHLLWLVFTILFFFGLSYYISTTVWGSGRFDQTSIFNQLSGVSIKINEEIFQDGQRGVNPLITHLFHNKILGYSREFLNQYLLYFSPILLFIDGWHDLRYVVPEQGIIYITFLLSIIAIFVIRKKNTSIDMELMLYLLFLFLLAPVPAAFTVVDTPNFHRAVFTSYFIFIFASYGFYKTFFVNYKKISLGIILSIFLLFEFIYFWHQYSVNMDFASSVNRNDGEKQVVMYVAKQRANYDKIYLPQQGTMSWYYLFYTKDFSPSYIGRFHLDAKIDNTNNIYYIASGCPTVVVQPKQLEKIMVINRPECHTPLSGWNQVASIQGINNLLVYKAYVPIIKSPKK